jgi:hypothetical protein
MTPGKPCHPPLIVLKIQLIVLKIQLIVLKIHIRHWRP